MVQNNFENISFTNTLPIGCSTRYYLHVCILQIQSTITKIVILHKRVPEVIGLNYFFSSEVFTAMKYLFWSSRL
jgi:hypothetical protein